MLTKLLFLLFTWSIVAEGYDDKWDPSAEYNTRDGSQKTLYTHQVWGVPESSHGQDASTYFTRSSRDQSGRTKGGPKPGADLDASASGFSITLPSVFPRLHDKISPSRVPSYAEVLRQPASNYNPAYTNGGGAQMANPNTATAPGGQPSSTQYDNTGGAASYQRDKVPNTGVPVVVQVGNAQHPTYDANAGSYSYTGQQLAPNPAQNYQAPSQNGYHPDGTLVNRAGDPTGYPDYDSDSQAEGKPLQSGPQPGPAQSGPGASAFALSTMQSGIQMMQIIGRQRPGNTVISPISISTVLSILQQGAGGRTKQELYNFLQSDTVTSAQRFNEFSNGLKKTSGSNVMEIANGVFVDKTFTLSNGFKTWTANQFRADVDSVDFRQSGQAANTINTWVNRKTHSLIPTLVDSRSLEASTQLLLTNAVFFKGIWNTTFSASRTVPRVFSLQPGRDKNVSFMHQTGSYRAGKDNTLNAKWLFLPFLNLEFNMLCILPNAEFGLDGMLDSLTPAALDRMIRDQTSREVIMGIPKFKLSLEIDLVDTLSQMSLNTIFGPSADLSGLGTSTSKERLYVSKVLHKATIEIDEKGGAAAAVTGLAVNTLSLASYNDEFRFTANHPFLVLLLDKTSSVPLFIAKITDP